MLDPTHNLMLMIVEELDWGSPGMETWRPRVWLEFMLTAYYTHLFNASFREEKKVRVVRISDSSGNADNEMTVSSSASRKIF